MGEIKALPSGHSCWEGNGEVGLDHTQQSTEEKDGACYRQKLRAKDARKEGRQPVQRESGHGSHMGMELGSKQ